MPLPLNWTEPGDEAEIVNWSALAGLLPRATATALESAAANRRGLLMGLQPVESVLANRRQHVHHRRILDIVWGQLYLIFSFVSNPVHFRMELPFLIVVSPSVEVTRTVPPSSLRFRE